jgi:Domain of unknown function (DUF4864)
MIRSFLLALLFLGPPFSASAAEVSTADAAAIRMVIEQQLDAFARDDARRAFALATSGIRARFGTAEAFMAMVRADYPVVYRPRRVEFDKPVMVEGDTVQPVRMIDANGAAWMALYPMQRQANGAWRINGCQLARVAGRQV